MMGKRIEKVSYPPPMRFVREHIAISCGMEAVQPARELISRKARMLAVHLLENTGGISRRPLDRPQRGGPAAVPAFQSPAFACRRPFFYAPVTGVVRQA